MSRPLRRVVSGLVLALVLWLIWSRLRIVVFVALPWWGALIAAVLLFLALDYLIAKIMR